MTEEKNNLPCILKNQHNLENFDSIYKEVFYLISLNCQEIETEDAKQAIDKVFEVTIKNLMELENDLKKLEDQAQVQTLQEADSLYLSNYKNNKFNE